jgi:hypothetical protein
LNRGPCTQKARADAALTKFGTFGKLRQEKSEGFARKRHR